MKTPRLFHRKQAQDFQWVHGPGLSEAEIAVLVVMRDMLGDSGSAHERILGWPGYLTQRFPEDELQDACKLFAGAISGVIQANRAAR
jgi:hypothetical protein